MWYVLSERGQNRKVINLDSYESIVIDVDHDREKVRVVVRRSGIEIHGRSGGMFSGGSSYSRRTTEEIELFDCSMGEWPDREGDARIFFDELMERMSAGEPVIGEQRMRQFVAMVKEEVRAD